jgi:hypothetical protein
VQDSTGRALVAEPPAKALASHGSAPRRSVGHAPARTTVASPGGSVVHGSRPRHECVLAACPIGEALTVIRGRSLSRVLTIVRHATAAGQPAWASERLPKLTISTTKVAATSREWPSLHSFVSHSRNTGASTECATATGDSNQHRQLRPLMASVGRHARVCGIRQDGKRQRIRGPGCQDRSPWHAYAESGFFGFKGALPRCWPRPLGSGVPR